MAAEGGQRRGAAVVPGARSGERLLVAEPVVHAIHQPVESLGGVHRTSTVPNRQWVIPDGGPHPPPSGAAGPAICSLRRSGSGTQPCVVVGRSTRVFWSG